MVLLQVEATDVLTPIVGLASAFIAAIVTLTVAVLRFGLGGRAGSSHSSVAKTDLDNAVNTICTALGSLKDDVGAIRQELTANGKVLAEIRGKLSNPGEGEDEK